jgi:hypothetical protein
VTVRFGSPLRLDAGEDYHDFSVRLQEALAKLADEDATTWWESLRRDAERRTPAMTGPVGPRWRRVWESTRPLPRRSRSRVWPRSG